MISAITHHNFVFGDMSGESFLDVRDVNSCGFCRKPLPRKHLRPQKKCKFFKFFLEGGGFTLAPIPIMGYTTSELRKGGKT